MGRDLLTEEKRAAVEARNMSVAVIGAGDYIGAAIAKSSPPKVLSSLQDDGTARSWRRWDSATL